MAFEVTARGKLNRKLTRCSDIIHRLPAVADDIGAVLGRVPEHLSHELAEVTDTDPLQ